jgi:glycosyltransferase involved in cell wall biosynthesis
VNKNIFAFTQAYNAEKTIRRCADSVLNQSYNDIIYYLVDNNSTDSTKSIIEEYHNKDKRIIPIFSDNSENWHIFSCIQNIINTHGTDGYFIVLDADDEYLPGCFEKLLFFLCENHLDIASCTSNYVDGFTNENKNKYFLNNDIIVHDEYFEILFPQYFRYARDSWGKLYSLSVFKDIDFKKYDCSILSGSVSPLVFDALKHSSRFGILANQLHKYYIYPDSLARSFTYKKVITPKLYSYYKDYLISKCGRINSINNEFFYSSYLKAIQTKLPVIIYSPVDVIEKLKSIYYILSSEITSELFLLEALFKQKDEYLNNISQWLNIQSFLPQSEECKIISEICELTLHFKNQILI